MAEHGIFWSTPGSGKSRIMADILNTLKDQRILVVADGLDEAINLATTQWEHHNGSTMLITSKPCRSERDDQPAAFDSFTLAARGQVLQAVCGLLGGQRRDLAEEVVQAALVVVWQRMSKPDRLEHPEAYAKKVAVRLALKQLEAERRMQPTDVFDDEEDDRESNKFRLAEMRLDLDRAIKALPPRMRAILRQYLSGKSYKEIAEFFKINEGTVGAQLSQARKRLRLSLDGWAGR